MIDEMRFTLGHAFRRAALPFAWYYAVTLGLPLANGAAQSGAAFVDHALFVVLVPPLLLTVLCTIHTTAQALAEACRSASHRVLVGRRSEGGR